MTDEVRPPGPAGTASGALLESDGHALTGARSAGRGGVLPWRWPGSQRSNDFIDSLGRVAGVVSSSASIDDVLQTVVDQAKQLVEADKTILCLAPEGRAGETCVDNATVVVRGSVRQHPETWWHDQVRALAPEVCETGRPRLVHSSGAWLLCVPITSRDRPIGVLVGISSSRWTFGQDHVALLSLLGALAGAAIENARLANRAQSALLAGERGRIAREMHDGLSQKLFSVSLSLEVCQRLLGSSDGELAARLASVQKLVGQSLAEVRRYIYDLRPLNLDRLGLPGSINLNLTELATSAGFFGRIYVEGTERPVDPSAEACLYRVAQEALTNVARHAEARSVTVLLDYREQELVMVIEDDGRGFDVDRAVAAVDEGGSIGLRSMRERVAAQAGQLCIVSRKGGGTEVRATVPCA